MIEIPKQFCCTFSIFSHSSTCFWLFFCFVFLIRFALIAKANYRTKFGSLTIDFQVLSYSHSRVFICYLDGPGLFFSLCASYMLVSISTLLIKIIKWHQIASSALPIFRMPMYSTGVSLKYRYLCGRHCFSISPVYGVRLLCEVCWSRFLCFPCWVAVFILDISKECS